MSENETDLLTIVRSQRRITLPRGFERGDIVFVKVVKQNVDYLGFGLRTCLKTAK